MLAMSEDPEHITLLMAHGAFRRQKSQQKHRELRQNLQCSPELSANERQTTAPEDIQASLQDLRHLRFRSLGRCRGSSASLRGAENSFQDQECHQGNTAILA